MNTIVEHRPLRPATILAVIIYYNEAYVILVSSLDYGAAMDKRIELLGFASNCTKRSQA